MTHHWIPVEQMFYWVYAAAKSRIRGGSSKQVVSGKMPARNRRAKRALRMVARPPSPTRANAGFRPCVALKKGLGIGFHGQEVFIRAFW